MKMNCVVLSDSDLGNVRREITQIQAIVQSSANDLAIKIKSNAPLRSGDLVSGIRPSDWEENSAYPGKVVRQVHMDADMNDTFVKMTKNGKRYYYPASQEFGFEISRRSTLTPNQAAAYKVSARSKRVPGKFFMNDSFVEYIPDFAAEVAKFVDKVVSK